MSVDARTVAAVFVGGAVGTLARTALATTAVPDPGHWPWPTFVANILGTVLLGFVGTRLATSDLRRPLWGTGVCGGLTTFSTVQVETLLMIQHGSYLMAVGYTAAGIIAGLLAVHLARGLVRR
ncbi:MAG: fluoride efflux transporter CrcB [Mycobacterium sp.]|nr:fluoride efflux transporter CrcB [Mycobacterium sp.]